MADPTSTPEELEVALNTQFEAYMTQVKRLIKGAYTRVKHALNSDRINGYSLADLIALIRGEVKQHEDDPNNPHNETLAQLGGMTTSTFETLTQGYFKKDAVPVSKIPALPVSVAGTQLSIGASQMIYMGRFVATPSATLALTGTAKLYLKLNIANPQPGRVASLSLEANDSETIKKFIVGIMTFANGVWTPSMIPGVFLAGARLSEFVHGNSVPYSPGTQAAPSTINNAWFS